MEKILELDKKAFLYIYNNTKSKKLFNFTTKVSKPLFIIIYLCILLYAYFLGDFKIFILCLIEPFLTIIISKILRKIINRKRPYLIFENLNLHEKKDASLPSNHTASSFIISFMFFFFNYYLAFLFMAIACFISISRVVVGLHFPLDIITGFLVAIIIFSIF